MHGQTQIAAIRAAQRLDSRGKPTVQVRVTTDDGTFQAIVPSGASKGNYEAIELRDGDNNAFKGNGVLTAVHNVEYVLGPAIIEKKYDIATDLEAIDRHMISMDGTYNKARLGANAILGISMACTRAAAAANKMPLYEFIAEHSKTPKEYVMPVPFFNVLNGGVHSGNTMAFQEFMIAPVGALSFADAVRMGAEVYAELKIVITEKFGMSAIGIGDEGGFAPPIAQPHEALDLLVESIQRAGHEGKFEFGIDPASSEFFKDTEYDLGFKGKEAHAMSRSDIASLYRQLIENYPIALLEDPFAEDDWESWTEFNKTCMIELVGDDLLATNINRIKIAHDKAACNALLLKINQIGTITESIAAAQEAYKLGWNVFVSHRSGETTDDFIADLTVGLGTGHLKSGAPCRGERVAKYNRLMDIEDDIKSRGLPCRYAGTGFNRLKSSSCVRS